jgi:hypothetical protein
MYQFTTKFCLTYPEDTNCNKYQNVVKASKHEVAKTPPPTNTPDKS